MKRRFVAFLRAINVGGHNVKMDRLRHVFESIGFSGVETFIASGNVVFESASKSEKAIEKKLEDELRESFGYAVATYVRSVQDLAEIARYNPFKKTADGATLFIAFLSEPLSKAAEEKLLSLQTKTDKFHFHGREIYWLCLTRFSDSKFSGPLLEKVLGVQVTTRNSSTVRKLAEKCESRPKVSALS
jgi:uncharacterized protein (DUF1697 family)